MIRLLLTDVGHPAAPSTIMRLYQSARRQIRIAGVDSNPQAVGLAFTDSFHHVPDADTEAESYLRRLSDICQQEEIDLIVPWSDAEAEIISGAASTFRDMNVRIMCSSYESVIRTVDKAVMLKELEKSGIETPDFRLASSRDELEQAAGELGYPDCGVVVKPGRSHGTRGIWFLNSHVNLFQKHPAGELTLEALLCLLSKAEEMPEYVVMPYLPGPDYSVDVLADDGDAITTIIRQRLATFGGASVAGVISHNSLICDLTRRIVSHFGLRYVVNLQMRCKSEDEEAPLIYEINPRPAGTVVAAEPLTGSDILYKGILMAMEQPVDLPAIEFDSTPKRFVRYWMEHYW